MRKQTTASKWEKLDNTANLFPVIATENMTNVYRISVVLTEEIIPSLLQEALDSPTIVVMTDRIDLDDQLYEDALSGAFRIHRDERTDALSCK